MRLGEIDEVEEQGKGKGEQRQRIEGGEEKEEEKERSDGEAGGGGGAGEQGLREWDRQGNGKIAELCVYETCTLNRWRRVQGQRVDGIPPRDGSGRVARAQMRDRRITFRLFNHRRRRLKDGIGIEIVDNLSNGGRGGGVAF